MSHLSEALLGWLILVGMIFGSAGALLFLLHTIRSLVLLARRIRIAPPEMGEVPSGRTQEAPSR
jgi:hypothetical protein